MVTCTITPFRAAVRLNSGVRPQTARPLPKAVGVSPRASLNHPRPASGITQTRYASAWWQVRVSRRGPCSSWACKKRGVSGLTIRSSRARFAASALAGYDLTIANAAQRPGLAQALDRSRRGGRSTDVRPSWRLFFPRLAQALILVTNSAPARAPALRFWVQHFAKSDRQFYTWRRSQGLGEEQRLAPV
jgi:hypothetical protein